MTTETRTCPSCKDEFDYDPDTGEGGHWSGLYADDVCEGCYEDPYPSAMHRFNHEGHDFLQFGDVTCNTTHDGDLVDDGEFPDWFTDLWKADHKWDGRPYKHTDGWRGYYDTEQLLDLEKVVKVTDGWVTGNYPDVPWKNGFHDFYERIVEVAEEGDIPEGVTLLMLFEPTSNVFSASCCVFVLKEHEAATRAWLQATFGEDTEEKLAKQLG